MAELTAFWTYFDEYFELYANFTCTSTILALNFLHTILIIIKLMQLTKYNYCHFLTCTDI